MYFELPFHFTEDDVARAYMDCKDKADYEAKPVFVKLVVRHKTVECNTGSLPAPVKSPQALYLAEKVVEGLVGVCYSTDRQVVDITASSVWGERDIVEVYVGVYKGLFEEVKE